jgi:hypothetical protein
VLHLRLGDRRHLRGARIGVDCDEAQHRDGDEAR